MQSVFVRELALGGSGPRVAIKDTIDVAGFPTCAGSRVFAGAAPAERHAEVVQALLDSGCRIIGKTVLHELAYGVTGFNSWTGTPINPRYPDRMPGGSSSGSAAAVAAGLADFALGTDTGGSVRVPAACCGVFGLKPSFGRVSRRGVAPASSSLDCVGPFARDLETVERAMAMIDPAYRREETPAAPVLGMVRAEADEAVAGTVADAVARSGLAVEAVELPSLAAAFDAGLAVIGAENWSAFGRHADSPLMGPDVRKRLAAAGQVTPAQVAAAEAVRERFAAEVDRALGRVDALVLPTMPIFPLTIEAALDSPAAAVRVTSLVRPFNLSGHPALSIPLEAPSGLPVGLQMVGARGCDADLCAVARRVLQWQ